MKVCRNELGQSIATATIDELLSDRIPLARRSCLLGVVVNLVVGFDSSKSSTVVEQRLKLNTEVGKVTVIIFPFFFHSVSVHVLPSEVSWMSFACAIFALSILSCAFKAMTLGSLRILL